MVNLKRIFISLLIILLPLPLVAQGWQRHYTDSLVVLKSRLESTAILGDTLSKASWLSSDRQRELFTKSMVLFTPLAYYYSPAKHLLTLGMYGRGDSTINRFLDMALVHIYLKRPDLVYTRESVLKERSLVASQLTETKHPIQSATAHQVVPIAEETEPVLPTVLVHRPNFWSFGGDYSMQFMQNYISGNWYKGGESNYSMLGNIVLLAGYNNKQKIRWDNKLEVKLGAQTSRADTVHSFKVNSDLLRLTSKLGLQASRQWYYTLQVIASTQMMHAYKNNSQAMTAAWLAPFTLNASLGMDYNVLWLNKCLKGTLHLAPFAVNWKYVDRLALSTRYGLQKGRHNLLDYGSELTADLQWKLMDNVYWKTRLYGYTTYKRAELEWENTFVFKLNKYLSTNLFVYPRFDDGASNDNHHGYWQFKEYLSIGFNYGF